MDSIFLAQLMGVYLLVEGIFLLTRQAFVRSVISDLMKSPGLRLLSGLMALIIGLVLVLNHNIWAWSYEGIITILSWLIVLKSVIYLLFSEKIVLRCMQMFNKTGWYVFTGLVAIVIGGFLATVGFGFL